MYFLQGNWRHILIFYDFFSAYMGELYPDALAILGIKYSTSY